MKLTIDLPTQPMPDNVTLAFIEGALAKARQHGHTMDAFGYAEAGPLSPDAHIPAWMSVCTTSNCYACIVAYGGDEPSVEGTALTERCALTLDSDNVWHVPTDRPRKMRRIR